MGTTPLTLSLENSENHTVTFKKEGFKDMTCQINSSVHKGVVVLDILGGLLPVIVDAATGKWKRIEQTDCAAILPAEDQ